MKKIQVLKNIPLNTCLLVWLHSKKLCLEFFWYLNYKIAQLKLLQNCANIITKLRKVYYKVVRYYKVAQQLLHFCAEHRVYNFLNNDKANY